MAADWHDQAVTEYNRVEKVRWTHSAVFAVVKDAPKYVQPLRQAAVHVCCDLLIPFQVRGYLHSYDERASGRVKRAKSVRNSTERTDTECTDAERSGGRRHVADICS